MSDIRGEGRELKHMLVHPDGRFVAYIVTQGNSPSLRIVLLELTPRGSTE
jgi:hypothetical protein